MIEIGRPFLAAKGFNTNFVRFPLPYYLIISNAHVYSFMGTISHVHRRMPKVAFMHKILCTKNYNL